VQHDLDKVVDVLPEGLAQLLQLGVDLAVGDVEEVLAEETVVVHHELERLDERLAGGLQRRGRLRELERRALEAEERQLEAETVFTKRPSDKLLWCVVADEIVIVEEGWLARTDRRGERVEDVG